MTADEDAVDPRRGEATEDEAADAASAAAAPPSPANDTRREPRRCCSRADDADADEASAERGVRGVAGCDEDASPAPVPVPVPVPEVESVLIVEPPLLARGGTSRLSAPDGRRDWALLTPGGLGADLSGVRKKCEH